MNINQEQLIIFKTVIETGSFSAAARKLGKVPSAVNSFHIKPWVKPAQYIGMA